MKEKSEARIAVEKLFSAAPAITFPEAVAKIPGLACSIYDAAKASRKLPKLPKQVDGIQLSVLLNQPTCIKLTNGHAIGTLRITPSGISFSPANAKKASTGEIDWQLLNALSGVSKS